MPVFELSIGLGLIGGQFRAMARVGSILLHLILIAILGPWGLNHSVNVLIWNGAILVGNLILFTESRFWNFSEFRSRLTWPWIGLMVAGGFLPLLEPWGLFDTWPSHGLYASHAERTELFIHEDDLENWPKSIRDHVEDRADSPWIYLNLNGLSRSIRGVPLYPQSRATHAVAEDLADRHGGPHPVRILHWGHADRWTGRRSRAELIGNEAIRRYGTQYWLNAHPSRGRPDAPAPG